MPTSNGPAFVADARYYDQLVQRVRALPGVTRTGVVSTVPIAAAPLGNSYDVPGFSPVGGRQQISNYTVASAGYFKGSVFPCCADGSSGRKISQVHGRSSNL